MLKEFEKELSEYPEETRHSMYKHVGKDEDFRTYQKMHELVPHLSINNDIIKALFPCMKTLYGLIMSGDWLSLRKFDVDSILGKGFKYDSSDFGF